MTRTDHLPQQEFKLMQFEQLYTAWTESKLSQEDSRRVRACNLPAVMEISPPST